MGTVFLNGRFVAARRATVSVFDRGLLYGDGLFETMRSYRGRAFALDRHLDRLVRSARVLGLPVPGHEWPSILGELLRRNRLLRTDAWVRLTVTRGAAEPALAPPPATTPTTILMARRLGLHYARAQRHGVTVTVLPFARHDFLAEHKSLNYLAPVLGRALAAQHRADEGIFADELGHLREGTSSSLFVVRDGALLTIPANGILPGITRAIVLELAAAAGIAAAEQPLTPTDLRTAGEAFLTSSVAEIVPIVRVGADPIGGGRPGPVTRRLQRLYRALVSGDS